MTLPAELGRLDQALSALRSALIELRGIARDKPAQGDLVLVDVYADGADDLLGWLEEASEALALGREALACQPAGLAPIGQALLVCHERLGRVSHALVSDLAGYERLTELAAAGARRGAAWQRWAAEVKHALDWCQQPLLEAQQRLLACWSEITDHLARAPAERELLVDSGIT